MKGVRVDRYITNSYDSLFISIWRYNGQEIYRCESGEFVGCTCTQLCNTLPWLLVCNNLKTKWSGYGYVYQFWVCVDKYATNSLVLCPVLFGEDKDKKDSGDLKRVCADQYKTNCPSLSPWLCDENMECKGMAGEVCACKPIYNKLTYSLSITIWREHDEEIFETPDFVGCADQFVRGYICSVCV